MLGVRARLPFEQLRAVFQALVDEHGGQRSVENWV